MFMPTRPPQFVTADNLKSVWPRRQFVGSTLAAIAAGVGCKVFATEVAAEVTTEAFRYAGGMAVYATHPLQRYLRDISVAAQHLMVSDSAYETHGQFALGIPGADPLR